MKGGIHYAYALEKKNNSPGGGTKESFNTIEFRDNAVLIVYI